MDNFSGTIVPLLFLATFVIVLGFAVVQYRKVRKAQREHHHSVQAEVRGEVPGERSMSDPPSAGGRAD